MLKLKGKYKIARRLGQDVFEKTSTQKFALMNQKRQARAKANFKRRKMLSGYGKQLLEKQKLRYIYGLSERQLSTYVKKALASSGDSISIIYTTLESRLDSVIYRLGWASTRRMARQMVSHGHFLVNGKKLNVPSHLLQPKDQISVRIGSEGKRCFENLPKGELEIGSKKWLDLNVKKKTATITAKPERAVEGEVVNFNRVIEFYTR